MLEGEHAPGTGETALDLIDDQRHAGLLGDTAYPLEPLDIGRNHPALALHHLEDHRRRQRHAAFRVEQQGFQVMQVGPDPGFAAQAERATVVVGVRHELHTVAEQGTQRLLRPMAAHQAQRPLAHAMVGAMEGQHGAAAGGAAHQFQRCFHRIGTGRAAELDLGFTAQRLWQHTEQVLDEAVLDRRGQVQGVQRQLIGQYPLDRLDHHRVVVAQRQGAGAGQAVDELAAFDILHMDATGALECQRDAPRVAAGVGLLLLLALQQG
ncbi:hypothetical protein D3C79_665110 [compost metagenome]